ncbi:nucleoside deaminase [Maridesulfovibrio salexigens]|uniref:tRNA-specific adenosine deaminase n=1 Tax=Maridesulfovibrio salexigens (strain ATCC 14822 / DSM 2638 / NCIMB 8403 / VKM B-1763) TaxID=526222 RepID=C6BWN9_MARSD|nr:nucleoside deaminase [Maridesulfovibrio salexigens]ACS80319.1 CMP/dCMP deaminase zinc-binding [Maridesulfovibrio salexigens DSM 2638]
MTNIITRGTPPANPPQGQTWRSMMDTAIREAFKARRHEEVPIGAALFTAEGELLATGNNTPLTQNDPTGHAEVNCIRNACKNLDNYRLPRGTILVVTLEPCIMCLGAIIHARVGGVVFGAPDPKAGAVVSNLEGTDLSFANHKFWTIGGVCENECKEILQSFFLHKRKK